MYTYETHLHTCEASKCASTHAAQYPAFYKTLGYSGIFITDHFFNGNTCIPQYDSWERRVNEFCLGYEYAKTAGDAIDFPVFFGWEANYEGDEYLIYGLDKEWLMNHPDILSYSRTKQYDVIKADGGLVVQAHPFRVRNYLNTIRLNPETCDAMEGYNSFNYPYNNHNAEKYCIQNNIYMTAGSDLHKIGTIEPTGLYGMDFDKHLTSSRDYVNAILSHQGRMHVPASDRSIAGPIEPGLPVVVNHREPQ